MKTTDATILEWARANECSVVGLDDSHGPPPIWVEVAIDLWDEQTIHFHIERYRSNQSNEWSTLCDFQVVVKKITEFIALASERPLCIKTKGRMTVQNADLPERGLIARLLRTSDMACGVPISLTGGFLDVDNDLFTRIYFRQTAKKDAVNIEIDFQTEDRFGLDFLSKADEILKLGANCFIFERIVSEASNAT
ncbi:MAG TPA: hypothetical protein VMV10_09105 [Pirellulales bacterium]|nr:hypothetical protein [Pirellulales bacterium]